MSVAASVNHSDILINDCLYCKSMGRQARQTELTPHHQRIDGEGALASRQYDHRIQIQFGDVVAQIVGEP
jgi:hypothetical protein